MGKYILKHTQMTNTFDTKIILYNYILYERKPSYVVIFPENLRMTLIFTDFQTEVGLNQVHCWNSVNIRGIPKSTGKLPM